jgi:nascent polypeptide-associated complex subunit alpha
MAAAAVAPEKAVAVEEDVPVLEAVDESDEQGDKTSGKQAKRYAKAMAKMGLKPEANIMRVMIRRTHGMGFTVNKPEVYRFPGTNTFVIFGEALLEDAGTDKQRAAAAMVAPTAVAPTMSMSAAAPAAATEGAAADGEDGDEDATGLQDKEINVVMAQAGVSRGKAIQALRNNNGDIVNAIMELTM